ncbi:MAG: Gfo/Idh/MocA family oxidoreductase [Anaerolineae bacterium]|nr:Gfo/Idh/MocA family oxidoreductase [Anaerolineae bacterium]
MSDTRQVVRLGVLGTRRGLAFAEAAEQLPNVDVVAFCGRNPERNKIIGDMYPDVRMLSSYEDMLNDGTIDAIAVANYADEHVTAGCQALDAGKHVLSEVPACVTVADGVKLARTVENSGKVYMFGENFCYLAWVQEMRRLYESGALGELVYAEGEYMHFARDVWHQLVDLDIPLHWRSWMYPTFYVTHSMGPILRVTGMRPVAVQAATGMFGMNREGRAPLEDPAMELVRLENGALVKSLHGFAYPREPWQPWYLIAGAKGCIESNRWPDPADVTVFLDGYDAPRTYRAEHPRLQEESRKTQHWGSDLFVLDQFAKSIQTGSPPDIDVYMGLDMTLVGILGWRSVLQAGGWVEIPNLRDEAVRKEWENDHYSCKPGTPDEFLLPNRMASQSTVLPGTEVIEQIRKRQESEPYHAAMYHDWGGEKK